jgi:hypothetical protein
MFKDKIYKSFDSLLQREIIVKCNNKSIKHGLLKIVDFKDFFLYLTIETKGSLKTLELYYPFNVQIENNVLILDYTIKSLTNGKKTLTYLNYITSNSKFLDNTVEILYQ